MPAEFTTPIRHTTTTPETVAAIDPLRDLSMDARWTAWVARGRDHDRAVARRLRWTLLVVLVLGALVVLVATAG